MKSHNINISLDLNIEVKSCKLKDIIEAFKKSIIPCFQKIVTHILHYFAEEYMKTDELANILDCKKVSWKTSKGNRMTRIMTIFGMILLPQLQVRIAGTGKRKIITRLLLGIEARKRIPVITIKALGLMGALASYRVVRKIASIFTNVGFSLMTILRSIRKTGDMIDFEIDVEESNAFDADGTGIPIKRSGKRGKELKVLAQRKKNGKIRIAGMSIGKYKGGWDKLFKPLLKSLKALKEIVLVTDGDSAILKGVSGIKVILQRCLFHIPHEVKYTLWQDKVKRKTANWVYVLSELIDVCNVKKIKEDESVAHEIIEKKKERLIELISFCESKGCQKTASYLENAINDMFSGIEKKVMGVTTSLLERMMRTLNMRINIGQWSTKSALAVCKIRGAYYYNGFDI